MNGYSDDLDALLEGFDDAEMDERRRRRTGTVRTPPRQSSFVPQSGPKPASQGQVQQTARSLDQKIETLSAAVRTLQSQTATLSTGQDRLATGLRKEADGRKRSTTALQADLQSTKMLSAILPMISQSTETATIEGKEVKVVTASDNQIATLLPLMLLMQPPTSPDASTAARGPFGDPLGMVLMLSVLGKK
ncbi:MAG: hypothetical protein IR158_01250 [Cellulomonas sp.]|jgi:outer membrane murein-binding lipoprotein Lpp|uniref:hypothetical protein n=1 Tax=Cellulomonas sp. TaxID=40001 RepID=UPI0019EDE382|nr:hypothetical protein [Cellulomonas sp.]MBF0686380.1 hypothetical protein [Cellulomonas sp.]